MATNVSQPLIESVALGNELCVSSGEAFDAASPLIQSAVPKRSRLWSGAIWVVAGRSLGIVVTTLVNMALARWLLPDDFGSFLLVSSVLALASLSAMLGLNTAIVRFVAESLGKGDVNRARQSIRLTIGVAVVSISSVACVAALALGYFDKMIFGAARLPGIVPLMVLWLVLLAVLQLLAEGCRGLQEMRLASLFSGGQTGGLLSNLLFLLLIVPAILLGKPSLYTAIALNLVAMGVCLPLAIYGFVRAARARLATPILEHSSSNLSVRELLAFSTPMLMIQLLAFAATQADLLIAGICCPHDQLALYGAARRLTLLVALPVQMLNLTVIASIAESHAKRRPRELERVLRSAASLTALPSMLAIVVLILWGGPILSLAFGSYFRQAALPLGILSVGQLFLVFAGSSGCTLEMTGNQMTSLFVNLVGAIALVVIGTLAARAFGIVGLAIASSSVITVQSLVLWLLAKRIVGVWTHPTLQPSSIQS